MVRVMESIVHLADKQRPISEAAKTVNLAFSKDPLIRWLRPGARPWDDRDRRVLKWQGRRIQRFMCAGVVLSIDSKPTPIPRSSTQVQEPASKRIHNDVTEVKQPANFGAVVMLEPPQKTFKQRLKSLWPTIRLWFLDKIDPCDDPEAKQERIQQMLDKHDICLAKLRAELQPRRLWYLEVIAVKPSLHGQGLGGRMMREVMDLVKGDPIMLECTDISNIGFYQKYGFEVVSNMHLRDKGVNGNDDVVEYPVMIRR